MGTYIYGVVYGTQTLAYPVWRECLTGLPAE